MGDRFYIARKQDKSHEIRPVPMEGFDSESDATKAEKRACADRREAFVASHHNRERLEVLLPMLQEAVNG